MKNRKKQFAAGILAVCLLLFSSCTHQSVQKETERPNSEPINQIESPLPEMTVTVMDIGKADAILIETAQSAVLIDAGEKGDGDKVCALLQSRGIDTLDAMILTHLDKDHIGGAAAVIQNVEVKRLIQSANDETSDAYRALQEACSIAKITPQKLKEIHTFQLDDAKFRLLPAQKDSYENDNDYSIITELTYGSRSFLFAGDALDIRIREYLKQGAGQFDFFKVPHHGKEEKSSEALIRAVNSQYSVITCSKKNPPDDTVVALLKRSKAEVFLTAEGTVFASCDGKNLTVSRISQK